ncbi:hypothetical protein [Microcoleus sp. CAWBG640]|uniref:hypothetical protein n=1 Tax=Microcoleus sp. CAWBG640 TaxID=2841653 RepID=UPI00312B5E33
MDYETPDDLNKFLQKVVNNPFDNPRNTEAWKREVLKQDGHYHTKQILERGRADFNKGFNGLTPHDKVIIYCYYYMQMHIVSSFHVFTSSDSLLKEYILNPSKNIVFIDFGCGPLTSGVALAWYYRSLDKDKQLDFHYIGIDNSEAMIRKATEISQRQAWRGCTFNFLESYEDHDYILKLIATYLSSGKYQDYLIVLNYSYLFASSTLDVSNLAQLVEKILDTNKSHKICLFYQNPIPGFLNSKWDEFKSKSFFQKKLCPVVEQKAILSYRNTTGRVKEGEFTEIKLHFETLVSK